MADIATAYVQIVPSARGLKAGLSSIFGSEMPSAGQNAGNTLGSSMASAIKRTMAAAGIGTALKKALTEGSALQQSLGGVETLFKDSASAVIANAQQAYRTAGLSANDYMEQVTSFSASLLQSLGGNTAAAANVADMALRDMSDNANKFGTDMGRITDAYQGFAKGNYTMLDNLKLGYGGTKTEMQRLLADAQKLTGVKYDISNLSDVYSAIHAVQEELSVTGTTAKEASSTLTGSFNAMQAAFSDVFGNLTLGRDIKPSLNALAETSKTFLVGNLIPAVWNIITALPGALATFINALIPSNMNSIVRTAIVQLSTFISQQLPVIFGNGAQLITKIAEGFLSGTPGFLQSAANVLNQLLNDILTAAPSVLQAGMHLIISLASGLISSAPNIIAAATDLIARLLSTFASHLPDLLTQGISLIGQLVAGLISMIPDVISGADKIIENFFDAFGETDWIQLGVDIIDGIISGLWDAATSLYNAIKDIIQNALSAGQEEAEVNSPSRLFRRELGRHLPSGAALGVQDGSYLLDNAVRDMIGSSAAGLRSKLRVNADLSGAENGFLRPIIINLTINSEAKTAADLMREARYEAEKAVLLGV